MFDLFRKQNKSFHWVSYSYSLHHISEYIQNTRLCPIKSRSYWDFEMYRDFIHLYMTTII